jgi:hypothetical protein
MWSTIKKFVEEQQLLLESERYAYRIQGYQKFMNHRSLELLGWQLAMTILLQLCC